jgi:hypothetical protein
MRIFKRKFKARCTNLYSSDGLFMCPGGLRRHFKVPKKIKEVTIEAYTTEQPESVKVEVRFTGACYVDDTYTSFDSSLSDKINEIIDKLSIDFFYVKVYYD